MSRAKVTAPTSSSANTTTTTESNGDSAVASAHARSSLSVENVRHACTTLRTQTAYRSYRNGIGAWIRSSKVDAARYFEPSGETNVSVFTPKYLEVFLLTKMNASEKNLKVNTLGGYRSAVKDIYRQKKLALPAAYMDDMKTFFAGLKRNEADRNQEGAGEAKMAGKMALPYSVYERACKQMMVLNDGGFAHLYLTVQWNLMCRSQSVETIHTGHISNEDDSIGFVFHNSQVQSQSGRQRSKRPPTRILQSTCSMDVLYYCSGNLLGLLSSPRCWSSFSRVSVAQPISQGFCPCLGKCR